MSIRTRFAPSPTGELHIGGVRAALYAFLFARHNNGKFLLRIEDTDRARRVEGAEARIIKTLQMFDIEVDEGMMLAEDGSLTEKGEYGPYLQSERLEIYKKYSDELLKSGKLYRCFCTSERLEELREQQQLQKQKIGYDGFCRSLGSEESARRAESEPFVLRLAMPQSGEIKFEDSVRGVVSFQAEDQDDFVCVKSDGFPTYHFANVVDDHDMKITHVIRGEEWVSSTPKHIALYNSFGWDAPAFAHIPLLLNPDKTKLSKRQGDVAAVAFLEKGYLPEAIINFIALLGWNPSGEQEIYSLEELITAFDITKVNKAGAVFNTEKLDWLNRHYLAQRSTEELRELMKPYFAQKGLHAPDKSDQWWETVVQLEQQRIAKLSDVGEESGFLFAPITPDPADLVWKKSTPEQTAAVLKKLIEFLKIQEDWSAETLENSVKTWIAEQGLGNGDVLWPMRVALSGKQKSPDPFTLAQIHGKEYTLSLLQNAHDRLV